MAGVQGTFLPKLKRNVGNARAANRVIVLVLFLLWSYSTHDERRHPNRDRPRGYRRCRQDM